MGIKFLIILALQSTNIDNADQKIYKINTWLTNIGSKVTLLKPKRVHKDKIRNYFHYQQSHIWKWRNGFFISENVPNPSNSSYIRIFYYNTMDVRWRAGLLYIKWKMRCIHDTLCLSLQQMFAHSPIWKVNWICM